MKERGKKLAPFVPLDKAVIQTPAWKATSMGARCLYALLKSRHNTRLQNGVYASVREAKEELGSHCNLDSIGRWFRELRYYGFTVMISPAHHGVNGHGKAPHWRLTECYHDGQPPTRDYLKWNGEAFREQKAPWYYRRQKTKAAYWQSVHPVPAVVTVNGKIDQNIASTVPAGRDISEPTTVPAGRDITSLTTPCAPLGLPGLSESLPDDPAFWIFAQRAWLEILIDRLDGVRPTL